MLYVVKLLNVYLTVWRSQLFLTNYKEIIRMENNCFIDTCNWLIISTIQSSWTSSTVTWNTFNTVIAYRTPITPFPFSTKISTIQLLSNYPNYICIYNQAYCFLPYYIYIYIYKLLTFESEIYCVMHYVFAFCFKRTFSTVIFYFQIWT